MVKITTILYALVVLGALPALANAVPTIDGRFDPAEGYSVGYWVKFEVEGGKKTGNIHADDGELWLYQNATSGDLFVNFTQPLTLVDNSYGDNAIDWGKGVAPSGKNHKFKDLKGSDKACFSISDGAENVVFDLTLDYITAGKQTPSGFASLGATDEDYIENPDYPGWLFEATYEFQIDGSLFADKGFGSLAIPIVCDSLR